MATQNSNKTKSKSTVRNGKINNPDMKFARPVHAVTVIDTEGGSWIKRALRWIKYKLQFRDGWWSIPLFITIFYGVGLAIHKVFGLEWGFYDPAFIQPAFGAVGIVLILYNGVMFILWFYFRYLHRYYMGKHLPDEKIIVNYSKDDWRNLEAWQRILFLLVVIFGLLYLMVRVYLAIK